MENNEKAMQFSFATTFYIYVSNTVKFGEIVGKSAKF